MTILIILLILSIILNVFLIQRGISYIYQIEEVQRVYEYDTLKVYQTLQTMLEKMKELDIRGSYESDDEVGTVFKELKNLIEEYNETINQ
jgi:uncharacterized protein with PhoU and TrkA domain